MEKIDRLTSQMESLPKQVQRLQRQQQAEEQELERLRGLLELDDVDLFDATLNDKLINAIDVGDPDAERHRTKRYSTSLSPLLLRNVMRVKEQRMEIHAKIVDKQRDCRVIEDQVTSVDADLAGIAVRIRVLSDQLRDIRNAKDRLYRNAKGTPYPSPATAPVKSPRPIRDAGTGSNAVMTAEDLRNTSFETFELPTELGRFLGQLDRNKTAIALTGDSGAGKSHFAFELTKLFSDEGYRTKYYCLEEGFGSLTKQKIDIFDIDPEVDFVAQATIADVRRDARTYDLIVIDSFNKLNVGAEEFERLRTEFPRTIFIFIFQKTTSGSIRGGSSILFNSAATIDVVRDGDDRIAHMVKGRYGTQGWRYDINLQSALEPK